MFPHWDFKSMRKGSDKDILWTKEGESQETAAARGSFVLNWLWKRKEVEIGLVGHGGSFEHMMLKNDEVEVDSKAGIYFQNCELRSLRLYKSKIGFRLELDGK